LEKLESIGEFKILVAQLEIPIEVVIAAFRSGKSRGAITILNPAPFQELPGELLELTDWLIVNEHEFAGLHPSSLLPESDQVIGEIDIANLVVTLGAAGAVLSDGSITRITAPRSEAIDTTGAGDCLVGSFAAGLGLGLVASKALEFGVFCASESVASPGAQSSYPSRERSAEIFKSLNQDLL
jgi:ribokinase